MKQRLNPDREECKDCFANVDNGTIPPYCWALMKHTKGERCAFHKPGNANDRFAILDQIKQYEKTHNSDGSLKKEASS